MGQPFAVYIPYAKGRDPTRKPVATAQPIVPVYNVLPKRDVRVSIERVHKPMQDRAKHGGPLLGLVPEFREAVKSPVKLLPVRLFPFECDGGDTTCDFKCEREIPINQVP